MPKKKGRKLNKTDLSIGVYGEPSIEQNIIHYISKKYDSVPVIEGVSIENYCSNNGMEYEVYNCAVKFNFNIGIQNVKPYMIRIKRDLIDNYLPLSRLAKLKQLYESD